MKGLEARKRICPTSLFDRQVLAYIHFFKVIERPAKTYIVQTPNYNDIRTMRFECVSVEHFRSRESRGFGDEAVWHWNFKLCIDEGLVELVEIAEIVRNEVHVPI